LRIGSADERVTTSISPLNDRRLGKGIDFVMVQTQTTFRGVERSEALEGLIRKEAAKLDRFFARIVSCRVLVEPAHEHQPQGFPFHVRIELAVPGREIVVDHLPSAYPNTATNGEEPSAASPFERSGAPLKNVAFAVREAFRKARRRVQAYARRKTGAAKMHDKASRPHSVSR
jgi:hypothetical protein